VPDSAWNTADTIVAPPDAWHDIYTQRPALVYNSDDPEDEPSNPYAPRWIHLLAEFVDAEPFAALPFNDRAAPICPSIYDNVAAEMFQADPIDRIAKSPRVSEAGSPHDRDNAREFIIEPEELQMGHPIDDGDPDDDVRVQPLINAADLPPLLDSDDEDRPPLIDAIGDEEIELGVLDLFRRFVDDPDPVAAIYVILPGLEPHADRIYQLRDQHYAAFKAVHNDAAGHCPAVECAIRLVNTGRSWSWPAMVLFSDLAIFTCRSCNPPAPRRVAAGNGPIT